MANWKWFSKAHATVVKLTGGRLGGRLAGIDMVIVDTIGRKTGLVRSVPIACCAYEGDVVVVASNNGQDDDPAWWLNLRAHPEVEAQLGTERYRVRAEALAGPERDAAWSLVVEHNPTQPRHQSQTKRVFPIIRLRKLERLR